MVQFSAAGPLAAMRFIPDCGIGQASASMTLETAGRGRQLSLSAALFPIGGTAELTRLVSKLARVLGHPTSPPQSLAETDERGRRAESACMWRIYEKARAETKNAVSARAELYDTTPPAKGQQRIVTTDDKGDAPITAEKLTYWGVSQIKTYTNYTIIIARIQFKP